MPKMKTSRAAAKRFKKTGTGLLKRNKAYKSHILNKDRSNEQYQVGRGHHRMVGNRQRQS